MRERTERGLESSPRRYNPGMDPRKRRIVSLVSSGALALLTLSVFSASLNTGPASSVTRFNEAILRRDQTTLRNVTAGPLDSQSMQILQSWVVGRMDQQARFEVTRVYRKGDKALVYGLYKSPRYNVASWIFATRRYGRTWLVEPDETLSATSRPPGQ